MPSETSIEQYRRAKEIFFAALDVKASGRDAFVRKACEADMDLRREVESLLAAHDDANDFLESLGVGIVGRNTADEFIGETIGNYKITRALGAGGMGAVYLAERVGDFKQCVALKIVKHGINSAEILRRFHQERQILATLEHPNIARLIDGGTTHAGAPYFVMEYVEGAPLTEYVESESLSLAARLELFRRVCAAVEYAHRHFVVHRDLKPSNILVTPAGEPKLLDFGIAKLLKTGTGAAETATRHFAFTPEYASPEQVRGEPLSTASDVYSLGVILYELLAGKRPYKIVSNDLGDLVREVCETSPAPPSVVRSNATVSSRRNTAASKENTNETNKNTADQPSPASISASQLRGDLDNIVLKSLKKDPARRYESVAAFSEDLQRHLDGLPVKARPDTFSYRASKFVRRNRVAVAAALTVVAFIGGLGATGWQASETRKERERAERRSEEVRKLANTILFDFYDAVGETAGSIKLRRMMVERALVYLDGLSQEARTNADLRREMAAAYIKVGDVQGKPNTPNLGDTAGALESYRKAAAILEDLIAADSSNPETRRVLSAAVENIGRIQAVSNDYKSALETQQRALAMREALLADYPQNSDFRRLVADSHRVVGDAQGAIARMTGAVDLMQARIGNYRLALAIQVDLNRLDPENKLGRRMVAVIHQRLGSALNAFGEKTADAKYFRESAENHRRAIQVWLEDQPNDAGGRFPAGEYKHTGVAEANLGDIKSALENFEKARVVFENLLKSDESSTEYRRELAYLQIDTANALVKVGRSEEARDNYRSALETFDQLISSDPARVVDSFGVRFAAHESLGRLAEAKGKTSEATQNYRRALEIAEQWLKIAPENLELRARQEKLTDKIHQ